MNRVCLPLIAALFGVCPCMAQTSDPASTPAAKSVDETKAILTTAFTRNTYNYLPGPYHFLATFETFTRDGQPDGEGSIEKYFAAPGRLKVTTRFRGHTMNAYYVSGKWQYTDDGFDGTIITYFANQFFLFPLPHPFDGGSGSNLETKTMQLQGDTLDCGMYQFYAQPKDYPTLPKEVLCVSQDTHEFTLLQSLHFTVRYRDFASFLDRSIPRYVVVSEGAVVRCRFHVQQVDQATLDDAALTPPPDASPASPAPDWYATHDAEGRLTRRVAPTYPAEAQAARVAGPVMLLVLISRTGKVKDIQPIYAPSPELAQAAEDAVSQWAYAPFIRQGKPIETIASVHINFAFRR